MKPLTDQEVLDLVLKDDGNIDGNKVNAKYLEEHPELQKFLWNRYNDIPEDLYSNAEVIYRMINHIDVRPTCVFCGEPVPFRGKTIGYSSHCCYDCLQGHAKDKQERKRNPFKDTEINDENVLSVLSTKSGKFITDPKVLNKNKDLIKYLNERYDDIPEDKFSYAEVLYRMKYHVDVRPVCKVCGGPVTYGGQTKGFKKHCSNQCITKDKECLEKIARTFKKTSLEKYGVENPYQSEEIKQKIRNKLIERYGVDNPSKSEEIRRKIKNTNLEKYGYTCAMNSPEIKEQIKQKNLKNLGVEWPGQSEICREKAKKTLKEKYGYENSQQVPEIKMKTYHTKKKKGLIWKSKEEEMIRDILLEEYHDLIYHHWSNQYPHICDYYIPSLDLYIELQSHGSHYRRLFRNTKEDQEELTIIREKSLKEDFYQDVEIIWTIKDVEKYNDTVKNNLNFLSIYPKWSSEWRKYYNHKDQEEYYHYREEAKQQLLDIIQENFSDPNEHKQIIIGEC